MSQEGKNQNTLILFEAKIQGRVAIKKNGKRPVRTRAGWMTFTTTDRYKNWEVHSAPDLARAARLFNVPIKELCHAEFEFHFKNHAHEPDTSNCIEGPQDLMQNLGILEDDRLIVSLSAKKVFSGEEWWSVKIRPIAMAPEVSGP